MLKILVSFMCFAIIQYSFSQIDSSQVNGNYSANSTWLDGVAPDATTDTVYVLDNVNLNVPITINKLFDVQDSLTGSSGFDISVGTGGELFSGYINIDGDISVGDDGVFEIGAGDTVYVDNLNVLDNNTSLVVVNNGGALYVANDLFIDGSGTVTIESGGYLEVGNNVDVENDGTFNIRSNAAAQIDNDFNMINNADFILEAGATINVTGNVSFINNVPATIDGDMIIVSNFSTANNVTVAGVGTIEVGGTTTISNNSTIFGIGKDNSPCMNCTYQQGCSFSSAENYWFGFGGTNDWFNAANWSGGVPTSQSNVVILTGSKPEVNGSGASCYNLTINSGASLEVLGTDTLKIVRNLTNNGDFILNSSTIEFNGMCDTSTINGVDTIRFHDLIINSVEVIVESGKYELTGLLELKAGSFETNDSLRIISNAAGTGSIAEITGDSIKGEITMERYIDAGSTFWRYIGSAVEEPEIGQFNDDFVTSGYPGATYQNFPWVSVYNYDETLGAGLGYLECTGSTQKMGVGEGWQFWSGDTITGTDPFTFDLTGKVNQGDINLPVSHTSTGTPLEDGFNMICNPYPSTIDWDDSDWVKTNMANATYIQDPDTELYATYVSGTGTNGGSRYIASQQSFWVLAFAASPVLTAKEGVKSNVDIGFKSSKVYSAGLKMRLSGALGHDELVIRHIDEATPNVDYKFDAIKWWGGSEDVPQISAVAPSGDDMTVHSFNREYKEWSIPIKTIVPKSQSYQMVFTNIGEMGVPCVNLEDTYTGMVYLVEEGKVMSFNISDTTSVPRFILHVGKNYKSNVSPSTCFDEDNGEIELELEMPVKIDYHLTSKKGTVTQNGFGNPLIISNLNTGNYEVGVPSLLNNCDHKIFEFTITEPMPLTSIEKITKEVVGNDGAIELNIKGGTAPYTFKWSTGDTGNALNNLAPGIYSVLITDDNGCELEEKYTVSSILNTFDYDKQDMIFIYDINSRLVRISNLNHNDQAQFKLIDMAGKLVWDKNTVLYNGSVELELSKSLSEGVYLLSESRLGINQKIVISK